MGVIEGILSFVFGGGRNVVRETAEVFRETAESGAQRAQDMQMAALKSHTAEFQLQNRGRFDRLMDGINRIPRPAMALGCLGLFVAAMVDPVWFASRMSGIALVPEPLWWLLGVVVSFYFGARHQAKGQEFQRSLAQNLAQVPHVLSTLEDLESHRQRPKARVKRQSEARVEADIEAEANPALADWLAQAATK